jgi:pyruvate decarboxylase
MQSKHRILHHTLGDGQFDAFAQLQSHISADQAIIKTVDGRGPFGQSAAEQIDRVICSAIIRCRPTYLALPTDLFYAKTPRVPLDTPLTYKSIVQSAAQLDVADDLVQFVVDSIVKLYEAATDPIIIIDCCAVRYHVIDEVAALLEATGMTFYTTPLGKAALSESHPLYVDSCQAIQRL